MHPLAVQRANVVFIILFSISLSASSKPTISQLTTLFYDTIVGELNQRDLTIRNNEMSGCNHVKSTKYVSDGLILNLVLLSG